MDPHKEAAHARNVHLRVSPPPPTEAPPATVVGRFQAAFEVLKIFIDVPLERRGAETTVTATTTEKAN